MSPYTFSATKVSLISWVDGLTETLRTFILCEYLECVFFKETTYLPPLVCLKRYSPRRHCIVFINCAPAHPSMNLFLIFSKAGKLTIFQGWDGSFYTLFSLSQEYPPPPPPPPPPPTDLNGRLFLFLFHFQLVQMSTILLTHDVRRTPTLFPKHWIGYFLSEDLSRLPPLRLFSIRREVGPDHQNESRFRTGVCRPIPAHGRPLRVLNKDGSAPPNCHRRSSSSQVSRTNQQATASYQEILLPPQSLLVNNTDFFTALLWA